MKWNKPTAKPKRKPKQKPKEVDFWQKLQNGALVIVFTDGTSVVLDTTFEIELPVVDPAPTMVFMIPAIESEGLIKRSDMRLYHYSDALDGLVLQGGADVAPEFLYDALLPIKGVAEPG